MAAQPDEQIGLKSQNAIALLLFLLFPRSTIVWMFFEKALYQRGVAQDRLLRPNIILIIQ